MRQPKQMYKLHIVFVKKCSIKMLKIKNCLVYKRGHPDNCHMSMKHFYPFQTFGVAINLCSPALFHSKKFFLTLNVKAEGCR